MSYPFDQLTALGGANQQLALKFVDMLRASGQRQASIASHAFSALTEQGEGFTPGAIRFPDLTGLFKEIEASRQATIVDAKTAIDDWRENVGTAISAEAGQQQWTNALQAWSQLFVTPFGGSVTKTEATDNAPLVTTARTKVQAAV